MKSWKLPLANLAMKVGDMLADVSREVGEAIMDLDQECAQPPTSCRVQCYTPKSAIDHTDPQTESPFGQKMTYCCVCKRVIDRRLLGKCSSTCALHQEQCGMHCAICTVPVKDAVGMSEDTKQETDVILVCDPSSILVEVSDSEFIPLSD